MSAGEWKKARPILDQDSSIEPGVAHGRVEKDLEEAHASYEARAKAGAEGGKAKARLKQSSSKA
jgi:uncharacterized protein YdaU (DUF1376 family)